MRRHVSGAVAGLFGSEFAFGSFPFVSRVAMDRFPSVDPTPATFPERRGQPTSQPASQPTQSLGRHHLPAGQDGGSGETRGFS